jgi:hypothetical protein
VSKSRTDNGTAKEELGLMMAPYEALPELMAERISGYVEENSTDGMFERTVRSEEGSVLWSVNGTSNSYSR